MPRPSRAGCETSGGDGESDGRGGGGGVMGDSSG